ncbi:hypothetical protein CAPTEDRAFT_203446 [Capitella teleta]|uniref:Amidase domain-containing protein n=1 Tax=Capitella teleta TaxID=283909 RepID=R7V9G2_CAPTE|nr:hypothetical protein CAPTEDRAFT_203446 [Capitella teleta]|eukprot:ELU15493.1 hypothetical protein CAPTEDRAFT_203446 [Capitella teleta]
MADNLFNAPAIQTPSIDKLRRLGEKFGIEMTEDELRDQQKHIKNSLKSYTFINQSPEPLPPIKYARTPGYQPAKDENKFNAWAWKTDIQGASDGKLKGKTFAIKDNIPVAGVPMRNGTNLMRGYIPEFDATVITRILDAGGCIKGKSVCENMCNSGSSFTSDSGPVLNPFDPQRSAGGSSSGSAVLVKTGEVDMALGADQGGSIRFPSCCNGIVGLKPTWSLVPYTGICTQECSLDHVGPMARTVFDCAMLLEVLAGYDDGLDSRQLKGYSPPMYSEMLTGDLSGVKIGILKEGFVECDANVESLVRKAAHSLTAAGASVEEVSMPQHLDGQLMVTIQHLYINISTGIHTWAAICLEGAYKNGIAEAGCGSGSKGFYPTSAVSALRKSLLTNSNDLSVCMKNVVLLGEYIKETNGLEFYCKAQNMCRILTQQYDNLLRTVDILVMPTIKFVAPLLPKQGATVDELLCSAMLCIVSNTGQFDATGHPALTINAGLHQDLPVGMMIVGRHYDDGLVLNTAHAFEKIRDKK